MTEQEEFEFRARLEQEAAASLAHPSTQTMESPLPSPSTKAAPQEGTGYLGAITRGVLRAPGLLAAPGLDASEALLTKLGLIDPRAPGQPSEGEAAPDVLRLAGERLLQRTGVVPRTSTDIASRQEQWLPAPTRTGPQMAQRVAEEITQGGPFLRGASKAGRLAKELLTLGASGGGAAIGQQISPDSAVAEILGQLSGLGAVGGISQAKRLLPKVDDATAKLQMYGIMGSQIGDPALARQKAQESESLRHAFPGFEPSLAAGTEDVGLKAIELQARKKSPQLEQKVRLRTATSRAALNKGLSVVDEPLGTAYTDIEKAVKTPLQKYDETVNRTSATMQQRVNDIETRYQEREASLNPVTKEQAGELAVKELTAARETAKASSNKHYTMIQGVDQRSATVKPLLDTIDQLRTQVNPSELRDGKGHSYSFPTDLVEHIEALAGKGKQLGLPVYRSQYSMTPIKGAPQVEGEIPFGVMRGLRETVGYALRNEKAKLVPDTTLVGRLKTLQAGLEGTIEDNIAGTETIASRFSIEEIAALKKANEFYKKDVIEKFEQGPIAKLWQAGSHGEPAKMTPSKVVTTFIHTGDGAVEDARALKNALGANGTDVFRNAALSDLFTRAADIHGKLIPQNFQKWITQYGNALKEYPSVWNELSSLQKAQASVKEMGAAIEAMPKAYRSPIELESETARLFLNRPADLAVQDLLKDPHPVTRLAEFRALTKNDPLAEVGLKRAVWHELSGQMGLRVPPDTDWTQHATTVSELVTKHRPLLEALFPPEHLITLQRVARGEAILSRVPAAVDVTNAQMLEHSGLAKSVGTFWSRMFAVARGVVGEPFIITEAMSRLMVKAMEGISLDKQKEIVQHAILDPHLLRTLDSLTKGVKPDKVNQQLSAWVARMGQRIPLLGLESRQKMFYLPSQQTQDTASPQGVQP